jgi:archaellum component FlaC
MSIYDRDTTDPDPPRAYRDADPLDTIRSRIERLETRIERLEIRHDSLEGQFFYLREEQGKLNNKDPVIVDINRKLDAIIDYVKIISIYGCKK